MGDSFHLQLQDKPIFKKQFSKNFSPIFLLAELLNQLLKTYGRADAIGMSQTERSAKSAKNFAWQCTREKEMFLCVANNCQINENFTPGSPVEH